MRPHPDTFNEIRKAVHDLCGVVVAEDKEYLVVSRLGPVLARNGLPSYEALVAGLRGPDSLRLQEQVIEAITTRETSFNRDGHPFEGLRRSILPELAGRLLGRRSAAGLLGARSRCRVWCTAVATGQEAYSVAMAVADFLASRPGIGLTAEDFSILGTDICQDALAVARGARYTTPEVARGVSPEQRSRYFRHAAGRWEVVDSLRRGIEFRRLNLVRPLPNLGMFDLILCRNFLIYLEDADRRRLCQALHQALNPGGFLMIGAAESIYGVTDAFSTEWLGGTIVHVRR
jgi:chemotaxis protein methyltransferase CheR